MSDTRNDARDVRMFTGCLRCGGTGVRYNPAHRSWQARWDRERVAWEALRGSGSWWEAARHRELMERVPAENIPCDCRPDGDAKDRLHELIDAVRAVLDEADEATRYWHDSTAAPTQPDRKSATDAITALSWISAATHHAARRITAELEVAAPDAG